MIDIKKADTEYDVHPLLAHRYSPRAFEDRMLSEYELMQLFEAMRWAPSSMNEQPWRIIYAVKGEEAFEKITQTLNPTNALWASEAAVLLLTLVKKTFSGNENQNHMAHHDLGLAIGNLTLQATALGIGLHQMAGFSRTKAIELFNITEDYESVTAIALGYFGEPDQLPDHLRARELARRTRRPVRDFAFKGDFQQK